MFRKLSRQDSKYSLKHAIDQSHKAPSDSLKPDSMPSDGFEVMVLSSGLNPGLFKKVNKAMRREVRALPAGNNSDVHFGQWFSLADVDKLRSLERSVVEKAYLEGVYVAERYCALVDPGESAIASNANAHMASYLDHLKYLKHHHKHADEELSWIKKDYRAGTAGEDVVEDAVLVKRARVFYRHVADIHKGDSAEHAQQEITRVINRDKNALAAFIALRRALFSAAH